MINRVTCIGAGLIGSSWATLYAAKGLHVFLEDLTEEILYNALSRVKSNLEFLETKGLLQSGEAEIALNRVTPTINLAEALDRTEYVTESVTEDIEIKKQIFTAMDALTPHNVILASSSSGLLMTEIQKATTRPERCILAHPILPPHLIPLVEIAGGVATSKETIHSTQQFMRSMGKTPIILQMEVPGYIVNRLQAALWREAISLVSNGVVSAEAVDTAFCLGIGLRDPILGPFLRAHIAGKGIKNFLEGYAKSYGNRWRTMETWTSVPLSAAKAVIDSVHHMPVVQMQTLGDLERVRDEKLIQILKIFEFTHPFYSQ